MASGFFATLQKLNTAATSLQWSVMGLKFLIPAGVVSAIAAWFAAMQDRFWNEYGSLGVFLVMMSVFVAVSVALGCLGLAVGRLGSRATGEAPPPLPLHTLDATGLVNTVGSYLDEQGVSTGPAGVRKAIEEIYDALRHGHLKSWGYGSDVFPPRTAGPRSPRSFIDRSFWSANSIEEFDHAAQGTTLDRVGEWETATVPDPGELLSAATCPVLVECGVRP